jgi:hypothetical protein
MMALHLKPPKKSEIVIATSLPSITQWGAIRDPSLGPSLADEARFTCDACKTSTIVRIRRDATWKGRQLRMKEALDLHRLICTVGLPEDMRTYYIHYPRG